MKYRVRHSTRYTYPTAVDLACHVLRLRPRELAHQRMIHAQVTADPPAARLSEGIDHFGNHATWMFHDFPHQHFLVTLEAEIEVGAPPPPDPVSTPPWERVANACRSSTLAWDTAEFTFPSARAPADAAVGAYVEKSFPPQRPILMGLLDLLGRIRQDFKFQSGVTTITTPVGRVLEQRAGVCQDFSHLMIAGLRVLGLPARYVSGYIRTRPPPGIAPRHGVDQSHAWVGCWLGPDYGWVDLDPTNNLIVSDEHVVLAWGRDFGDVSPVRGVILGGGRHGIKVSVDLQPA